MEMLSQLPSFDGRYDGAGLTARLVCAAVMAPMMNMLSISTLMANMDAIAPASASLSTDVGISRLGRVQADPKSWEDLCFMTRKIRETVPVRGYFFDFSNQGGYYFLSERRNPTRFGLVNYIYGSSMLEECLDALAKHPPDAVLVRLSGNSLRYRKDLEPIARFISERYKPAYQIHDLALMTRWTKPED